eukprot:722673-Prorocentrum_minimum.AAC.3
MNKFLPLFRMADALASEPPASSPSAVLSPRVTCRPWGGALGHSWHRWGARRCLPSEAVPP